jgi:hypothetical protein
MQAVEHYPDYLPSRIADEIPRDHLPRHRWVSSSLDHALY